MSDDKKKQPGANMTERCQVCGDKLEDEDRIAVYLGILPEDVDDMTDHEYYCEECYARQTRR